MWRLLPFLIPVCLFAQDSSRARMAMQASIAKQRASVAKQVSAMRIAAPGLTSDAAPVTVVAAWRPTPVVIAPRIACPPVTAPVLSELIDTAAERHDLDPSIIREVARQESAFRPCAVSSAGAEGLMQLMPATQATLRVTDPFDPAQSIDAGARLLKQLLERYNGDLSLALSAYNAGPGRVDRTMTVPQIPETQNYVATIIDRLQVAGTLDRPTQ